MDYADDGPPLLCERPIWDWELTWHSERPRLSPCFRHLVLSVFPCVLLWLTTVLHRLFRSRDALHDSHGPSPWTLLAGCKQVLTCLLIVCTATQGAYLLVKESFKMDARAQYVAACVKLVTFVLVVFLQVRQRRHGDLSSLRLAVFWTLLLICEFFASPVFALIMDDLSNESDATMFVLGTVSLALVMSETILCYFTDPRYESLFCDSKTDEFLVDHQSPFSRLFFSWLNRLMRYGYQHVISVDDLDTLRPDTKTSYVCRQFLNSWYREEELASPSEKRRPCRRRPSLCLSLVRVAWPWMLGAVCLELVYDFATLLPPIILDWLITFMGGDEPTWHGYVYSLLLFFSAIFCSLLMAHNQNLLIRSSVIPRSGLKAAIYRKVFRLSLDSRRSYSLGELCNLVTVDVQRIFELVWDVNTLWSNPLRIALTVALLWQYLGIACLAGVAVILLLMVVTTIVAFRTNRIQKTQMQWKDARLRLMNEILNGVKVLKLFAWERPFMRQVNEVRERETRALRRLAFLNTIVVFLWILAPFLVAICSFVAFVLLDERNVLDPSIVFVSLTLFGKLGAAVSSVPQIVTEVVQSRISIRRAIDFLLCEELDTSDQQEPPSPGNVLELDNASFSWGGGETFLRNLTLSVERGDLVAVVGRVGAGKTALLTSILGEMTRVGGSLRMDRSMRVAYVPQSAWIQNTTLRQNVLFVNPMDKRKYDSVIRNCCLRPDLKQLPGGDLTEIGEKGVNLSGGQKQRVSLARAVYHDADLYVLDDPLSAVDAHVAKSLFADVIGPKGMLSQKTRLLVTHDLSVLPYCDTVVLMSEGTVVECGSYRELLQREHGELTRLVNEFATSQRQEEDEEATPSPDPTTLSTEDLKAQMRRIGNRLSRSLSRTLSVDKEADHQQAPTRVMRFIENEKMEIGRVRAGVYCTYFRSAGIAMTCLVATGFAAYQIFEIGANVWLSQWSADPPLPDGTQDVPLRNYRLTVYGLLGFAQGACILLGALILTLASTRASIRLHRSMLWSVLRSPLAFFDTTPLGRILNRFGKDIDSVDVAIPASLNSVVTVLASAAGTLVVICANHPLFLLIMVPISILYLAMQLFYMATSRQLRRLQSVTLSPVLSFFSESVQGASTVRAYGSQAFFTRRQDTLIDSNCKVFFNTTFVNRWLAVRLQLLGAVVVFVVALLSVVQRRKYSAALVGLTLSYALNVTDILSKMVRLMTQLETRMVSVERIDEYSRLEEEASWSTEQCNLSLSEWPRKGSIVFKGYQMRYRPNSAFVLKGIDLEIPGGQKVGVVGRTGAGKSSLAQALFRVVEPSGGALIIDGIDAAAIGLHDLREKITVIPQDPVLFGGNLRTNLDPTGAHSDEEVAAALGLARMQVPAGGLGMQLDEGGENLSVGQRQQVCLARALLKRTRILVLDEATAAVDFETDRLIQETIRSEFRDCTVITVAHRLHTVLDYDRILVMDKGKIAEDGPPDVLLKRMDSMFRELARSAGLL